MACKTQRRPLSRVTDLMKSFGKFHRLAGALQQHQLRKAERNSHQHMFGLLVDMDRR